MKIAGKIVFLVSLIITVVWGATGVFGGWSRSWIAVFVGVMVEAICQIVEGAKNDKKQEETPAAPTAEAPATPTVETPAEPTVETPTETVEETKTEQ